MPILSRNLIPIAVALLCFPSVSGDASAQTTGKQPHLVSVQTVDDDVPSSPPAQRSPSTVKKKATHGEKYERKKESKKLRGDSQPSAKHDSTKHNKTAPVPKKVPKPPQEKRNPVQAATPSPPLASTAHAPPKEAPPFSPYYASVRSTKVNLRAGPGQRFPISWVYFRRNLPVHVLREFDVWRYVALPDGEKGWIRQSMISSKRTVWIPQQFSQAVSKGEGQTAKPLLSDDIKVRSTSSRLVDTIPEVQMSSLVKNHVLMYEKPTSTSRVVAVLMPGTVGILKQCPANSSYCQIKVKNYEGWIPRHVLWGVDPNESFNGT